MAARTHGAGKVSASNGIPGVRPVTYAAITGWGKCLPPAILSNDDLVASLGGDRSSPARRERGALTISHIDAVPRRIARILRAFLITGRVVAVIGGLLRRCHPRRRCYGVTGCYNPRRLAELL